MSSTSTAGSGAATTCPQVMTQNLEQHYEERLQQLRTLILAKIPTTTTTNDDDKNAAAEALAFVEKYNINNNNNDLDDLLAEFVVLAEATPRGLADFVTQQQHPEDEPNQAALLLDQLLSDKALLKTMLLADGAAVLKPTTKPQPGKNNKQDLLCGGEAQYGPAMKIYTEILKKGKHAKTSGSVLSRLALAIGLEHAVPIPQCNAAQKQNNNNKTTNCQFVDPVQRYLHYEAAYLNGELDEAFDQLSVWDLRMVVNGDEPDDVAAWGRDMLRNFRPDAIIANSAETSHEWRYVAMVRSDVRYGSQDVQLDRPELQKYQKYGC
jgi:hypothetical protein